MCRCPTETLEDQQRAAGTPESFQGRTDEDLGVGHIGDLHLAGVVQQVHCAALQILEHEALPAAAV
jgi:hypothetical protein